MTVTLPEDKLEEILSECRDWQARTSATRKQLQSIAGKLQHVAKCVKPARVFMNRILAAIRAAPYRGRHPFPLEVLSDLEWFLRFAASFNRIVLLPKSKPADWLIECDSTLKGAGAFSPTSFYAQQYPPEITDKLSFINQLEALNLVHALLNLLPPDPRNYNVIVNTDNLVSQQIFASGSGRDPVLCACARKVWLISAMNSFSLEVRHKEGRLLILADALSRFYDNQQSKDRALLECKKRNLNRVQVSLSLTNIDFTM